jgi:hypothetical protein
MKHLLFFLFLISTTLYSQTRYPFGSKYKNIKTITLTNGKYDEFFDEDTLQRVGSSVININTKKITKIKLSQEEIDELENAQASRFLSVDPLTSSYPHYSPYQYAGNTPIQAIDIDGLEEYVVIKELYRNSSTKKITIYYIVDKDKVEQKINHKFKEVTGKNPDGTFELGEYLTNQKVIRITQDHNGKETVSPDDKLTKQEKAVLQEKSKNDVRFNTIESERDLKTPDSYYVSESKFKPENTQSKIATKNFSYIPPTFEGVVVRPGALISNFTGSSNYIAAAGVNPQGGQLGPDLISSLRILSNTLRTANNITSITINITQGTPGSVGSQAFNNTQGHAQQALQNVSRFLTNQLRGTNIAINIGGTNIVPNSNQRDLVNNGQPAGVNLQIR